MTPMVANLLFTISITIFVISKILLLHILARANLCEVGDKETRILPTSLSFLQLSAPHP